MPRLTWLGFAGNPFSDAAEAQVLTQHQRYPIDREQITFGEVLGQGASGVIYRADWRRPGQPSRTMAAKLFKDKLTSDGLPHSEMAACIAAGEHLSLIPVAGPLAERTGDLPGLLMDLIEPSYRTLAYPPSLASCSRDCYAPAQRFPAEQVLRIAGSVASAMRHLHDRGILHGDLYGHNLLVDPIGRTLLSDFGAASFYAPDDEHAQALQRLEARAFGCLLEELLERCEEAASDTRLHRLVALQRQCMLSDPLQRPDFNTLTREMNALGLAALGPAD